MRIRVFRGAVAGFLATLAGTALLTMLLAAAGTQVGLLNQGLLFLLLTLGISATWGFAPGLFAAAAFAQGLAIGAFLAGRR